MWWRKRADTNIYAVYGLFILLLILTLTHDTQHIRVASHRLVTISVKHEFLTWSWIFKLHLERTNMDVFVRKQWLMYNNAHLFNKNDQRVAEARVKLICLLAQSPV